MSDPVDDIKAARDRILRHSGAPGPQVLMDTKGRGLCLVCVMPMVRQGEKLICSLCGRDTFAVIG